MKNPKKAKATKATTAPAPVLMLASEDAMIGALNRYAETRLELATLQAANDEYIATIRTAFDATVQERREALANLESSIHLFCANHKAELFTDPKSREYANAVLGFALNPPSVGKILEKGDTFEAIAARMESDEKGEPYVVYKGPILDKNAILRDRANFTDAQLAAWGIKFVQEEQFFIEIKATAHETVTKPAEAAAA